MVMMVWGKYKLQNTVFLNHYKEQKEPFEFISHPIDGPTKKNLIFSVCLFLKENYRPNWNRYVTLNAVINMKCISGSNGQPNKLMEEAILSDLFSISLFAATSKQILFFFCNSFIKFGLNCWKAGWNVYSLKSDEFDEWRSSFLSNRIKINHIWSTVHKAVENKQKKNIWNYHKFSMSF